MSDYGAKYSDAQMPADAPESAKRRATVREMAERFLVSRGYSGLFNEVAGCGCSLDCLMECDIAGVEQCVAAYLFNCALCAKSETCTKGLVDGEREDWFVSTDPDYCRPDYQSGEAE